MPVPRYCQPVVEEQFASWPVRMQATRVVVPACKHHGDHPVGVTIGGRGLPLAVVHGYTASGRIYNLVLGLLARWFKVIAVDLAGHGETSRLPIGKQRMASYADLYSCTLRHLGVRRAVSVGHSMGGRVVAEAAYNHPEQALALILANAILGEPWDKRVRSAARIPHRVLPLAGNLAWDTLQLAVNVRKTDEDATLVQLGRETYLSHFFRPWRLAPSGLAILRASPSVPILDAIGAQGIPTFVVYGENDPIVSLEDAQSTAAHTKGSLLIIEKSSHSWLLADRRTLPGLMEEQLSGRLGEVLDDTVAAAGFDPAAVSQAEVEAAFYEPDARAVRLTPPVIRVFRRGGKVLPPVGWRAHGEEPSIATGE